MGQSQASPVSSSFRVFVQTHQSYKISIPNFFIKMYVEGDDMTCTLRSRGNSLRFFHTSCSKSFNKISSPFVSLILSLTYRILYFFKTSTTFSGNSTSVRTFNSNNSSSSFTFFFFRSALLSHRVLKSDSLRIPVSILSR